MGSKETMTKIWKEVKAKFDPGASSVNQENRIRLMLENARMLATE